MLEQEGIYLSRCSIRSDVNLKLGLELFLKYIYCAKYSDTWYVSVGIYMQTIKKLVLNSRTLGTTL